MKRAGIAVVLALLTAACQAPELVPPPPPPPNTTLDRVNDSFGTGKGTNWDIKQVVTERTASTLTIRITFVQPAARIPNPGAFAGTSDIAGYIDIDTDQNPATGDAPWTSVFCPAGEGPLPGSLGMELFISLFSRNPDAAGTYNVFVDLTTNVAGKATPAVSGDTLSIAIPLTVLGTSGMTNIDMALGNAAETTDCAPDGAVAPARPMEPAPTVPWGSLTRPH